MSKEGKYIASGSEKVVYEDPINSDRVIKKYKYDAPSGHEVVARGYLGKILHILFPQNVPELYQSASDPHQLVMERKSLDLSHRELTDLLVSTGNKMGESEEDTEKINRLSAERNSDTRVQELKRKMDDVGVIYDHGAMNFGFDDKGSPIYLDTADPWVMFEVEDVDGKIHGEIELFCDKEKLTNAINQIFDEDLRKMALRYLERLFHAYEAEKKRILIKQENVSF